VAIEARAGQDAIQVSRPAERKKPIALEGEKPPGG
jgi:hypothetical protein